MKRNTIVIITILIALSIMPLASARKGVGIVWMTQTEIVNENSMHCVQYGVYNPWDEDVKIGLSVSDELKGLVNEQKSEVKTVPANTMPDNPVPIEFCFKIKDVYPKECILGTLCKQTCNNKNVMYEGKVQAVEKSDSEKTGTGSKASIGVSVPLKLKVKCVPGDRDWTALYILLIVIALAVIGAIIYQKVTKRKSKRRRK